MDLLKIAARVAQGPQSGKRIVLHYHIDEGDPGYEELADDDGTISSEFSAVVSQLGGEVESWESTGMTITVPEEMGAVGWSDLWDGMQEGKHGEAAKKVADAYGGYEEATDEDGNPVGDPPGAF